MIETFGEARGIVLGPAWRRDCGVAAGDEVAVTLAPEGPQRDDLAPDVAAALAAAPNAAADSAGTASRNAHVRSVASTYAMP